LYRPADTSKPHGLVLYVHGGGWQSGHTRHSGAFENWPGVLASIAARGYVVASLEYRLSSEAPFPAAIQDVKAAIRWLRSHASEYGIDRQRAVIWGGSAGGQLAALAGTSCGVAALEPPGNESDCVQGVIAWYGIFDFATLASDLPAAPRRYLGCEHAKCTEAATAASATTYIDVKDPPVLMIHGVNDKTVPVQQSRDYLAALRSKGVPAELVEVPGVDHSFIGATNEATRAASLQALRKSLEFIDRTIGPSRN
jgi:acetyl esterase/lipase